MKHDRRSSRIEPSRGWISLKLRELWKYRELLYFLAWRDIKILFRKSISPAWRCRFGCFSGIVDFAGTYGAAGNDALLWYASYDQCALAPGFLPFSPRHLPRSGTVTFGHERPLP